MAKFDIKLPKMGESVAEATITSWLKNVGDRIELDEAIVEIATDKVDSEVPSEVEGTIVELLFEKDAVVAVGETIAIVETDTSVDVPEEIPTAKNDVVESAPEEVQIIEEVVEKIKDEVSIDKMSDSGRFYSPLVRNIAETEGVTMEELEGINGTGKDNRVTKNDILTYLDTRQSNTIKPSPASKATQSVPSPEVKNVAPSVSVNGEDEVIEMSRMGKLVAHHMVASVQTSAHVQSFIEVDVTNIVNWRNQVKDGFLKREGEKIT